jgi:Fe-Mn family superoxide dismutase
MLSVATGLKPIMTIDIWEHAYYLDYLNVRPNYLNTVWKCVDWHTVN